MSDEQNNAAAEVGEVTRFLHEWLHRDSSAGSPRHVKEATAY